MPRMIAFFTGVDEQNHRSGDGDVNSGRVLGPCRLFDTEPSYGFELGELLKWGDQAVPTSGWLARLLQAPSEAQKGFWSGPQIAPVCSNPLDGRHGAGVAKKWRTFLELCRSRQTQGRNSAAPEIWCGSESIPTDIERIKSTRSGFLSTVSSVDTTAPENSSVYRFRRRLGCSILTKESCSLAGRWLTDSVWR